MHDAWPLPTAFGVKFSAEMNVDDAYAIAQRSLYVSASLSAVNDHSSSDAAAAA